MPRGNQTKSQYDVGTPDNFLDRETAVLSLVDYLSRSKIKAEITEDDHRIKGDYQGIEFIVTVKDGKTIHVKVKQNDKKTKTINKMNKLEGIFRNYESSI